MSAGLAEPAHAALATDTSGFGTATVVDFSQFGPYQLTSGPVQVGGLVGRNIEWSSTVTSVIGSGGYALDDNGRWSSSKNHVGLAKDVGSMTFEFIGFTVSAVGGFINYAVSGYTAVVIAALDSGGNVLESYTLNSSAPISTPGQQDAGAFRGITRSSADIAGFRISNGWVVLDDLTFSGIVAEGVATYLCASQQTGAARFPLPNRQGRCASYENQVSWLATEGTSMIFACANRDKQGAARFPLPNRGGRCASYETEFAWNAAPAQTPIRACANRNNLGAARLLKSASMQCASYETAFTWAP